MRTGYLMMWAVVLVLIGVWNVGRAQDSLGMRQLSALDYWPGADDIQMVGDLAYVSGGPSGLHIMNLSDPAHPVEIGRYTWYQWDAGAGIYVADNRAYVCLPERGIVLDVSDPTHPVTLGQWEGSLSDITLVHGNIAIAESEESYPYVLDISDPANVHEIGRFTDIVGPMDALGMAGEYLCMKGWPGGVIIYDISNPAQPQRVASCDTILQARYGTLTGNYAYIATYFNGLHIIDLTNPLQPVLVATCDSLCYDVTVTGTHAVVSSIGLNVWDVADPAYPVFEGTLVRPAWSNGFGRVSGSGSTVCVENWGAKVVKVVDISNPAAPAIVGEFGNYGILGRMAISGTNGYLADSRIGLRIINLADQAHVIELANMSGHSCAAWNVAIAGNYAYLAEGPCGVLVADVSNPAQPESLRCVRPTQFPNVVRVLTDGNYAYVFNTGSFGGPSYIHTFSLANPEVPQWVDSLAIFPLDEWGDFDVTVSNGYLYLVQGWNNFSVFSLANPTAPLLVGSCGLPHLIGAWARGLAIAGNYAYVANCHGGVVIVNISNPTSPGVVTQMGDYSWTVAARGNTLFTDDLSRITVMDMTDPTNPTTVGYYSTDEQLVDMEIQGQNLFTTSISQFRVYQCDALPPDASSQSEIALHEFALHPCYPNPFNPSTVIRFSLPKRGHAKLTVYDVTGRQVKVLADGILKGGEHSVTFDGTATSTGVYFARLEAGKNARMQKMMLLK
jgi:hypothetical protein